MLLDLYSFSIDLKITHVATVTDSESNFISALS